MDKKEAAAQLKLASKLFREGEALRTGSKPKSQEKFQEALTLTLKIIETSPNLIDAYELVSQIFLRLGDRKSFLHYVKGKDFLKSGGRFPEPELLPEIQPMPEFEHIDEIREEIKPKKKKQLQTESTVTYPPRILPFPKPVLQAVTSAGWLQPPGIPFPEKIVRGDKLPIPTAVFIEARERKLPIPFPPLRREARGASVSRKLQIKGTAPRLRKKEIRSQAFQILPTPKKAPPKPRGETIYRVSPLKLKGFLRQKAFSTTIPVPSLSIKVKPPPQNAAPIKKKIPFVLRRLPMKSLAFQILPAPKKAPPKPRGETLYRVSPLKLKGFLTQKAFSTTLPVPLLSIKVKPPSQEAAALKEKTQFIKPVPTLLIPVVTKLQRKACPLHPRLSIISGAKRPAGMRSRVIPPRVLPVALMRIKVLLPRSARMEKPGLQPRLRQTALRAPQVVAAQRVKLSSLPVARVPKIYALKHPAGLKPFPMPAKTAPLPAARKKIAISPGVLVSTRIRAALLKPARRFADGLPIVSTLSFSMKAKQIETGSVSSLMRSQRLQGILKVCAPLPFKPMVVLRQKPLSHFRLLRTKKPSPWFALPTRPVASLAMECKPRQSLHFPQPACVDHPKKKSLDIPAGRQAQPAWSRALLISPMRSPALPHAMAWRKGRPKGGGRPVILSFSPSPVKKNPIQMQAVPLLRKIEMQFAEEPTIPVSGTSVLDRIEQGEHPLLAYALELDQEGDKLILHGKKEDAAAVYADGAAALIEAGEVQSAAEMFGKALRCLPGNMEILKRLDRLQTQGAILRPEVKLEIHRKIYGLKL